MPAVFLSVQSLLSATAVLKLNIDQEFCQCFSQVPVLSIQYVLLLLLLLLLRLSVRSHCCRPLLC
jgi:hypothetical protein